MIGQVLNVEPKPVTELRPDVPAGLAEICHRGMAKNLSDRFASMKEFAAALTEFLKGTTFVGKPAAPLGLAPLPDLEQIDDCCPGHCPARQIYSGSARKRASVAAAVPAVGIGHRSDNDRDRGDHFDLPR